MVLTQGVSQSAGQLGCWLGLQSLPGLTGAGESTYRLTHLAFGKPQLLPGCFCQRERERERDAAGFLSWFLPYGCGTVDKSLNGWTLVPSFVEGADYHSNYLLELMKGCNWTCTVFTTGPGTESALDKCQLLLLVPESAIHYTTYLLGQKPLNHRARHSMSSLSPKYK